MKNVFSEKAVKLPTTSPWGGRRGVLVHCVPLKKSFTAPTFNNRLPALLSAPRYIFLLPPCTGFICGGFYQLNENYIHTSAARADTVYIMQQMSIGATEPKFDSGFLSNIKLEAWEECWQWCEFDEFNSKNIHFSRIMRMTNRSAQGRLLSRVFRGKYSLQYCYEGQNWYKNELFGIIDSVLISRWNPVICYEENVCYNIENPVRRKVMSFRKALKSTCKCIIITHLQYCGVKKKNSLNSIILWAGIIIMLLEI